MKFKPDPNRHILITDFEMISEVIPLFEKITNSFKLLESKELYLSKITITICYIQDEIYEFVRKCPTGSWHDNCIGLIQSFNNEIFHNKSVFTKKLLAAVVLDPTVTKIPTQITDKLDEIMDYIRSNINSIDGETFSPPIPKVKEKEKDPVEEKFCSQVQSTYDDDELRHWFKNSRPYEIGFTNPYQYWRQHIGHKNLRNFAIKLFVHAGSSVACERFFSLCSNMADDKRSSMNPDHLSALCVVKANIEKAKKILFEDDS